jgi:hypothetical protein
MGHRVRFLAALLLLMAAIAHAESITFELYELSSDGKRTLLAKGAREYTIQDILVEQHAFGANAWRAKEIPVAAGFSAGASIYQESDLTGFGLWLKDRGTIMGKVAGGGFSWDWFDRESGDIYRKLQGGGSVRVILAPSQRVQEIAAVEVLEDITLRVDNRPWFFFSHRDTHNLVLKKGSVLRFAP